MKIRDATSVALTQSIRLSAMSPVSPLKLNRIAKLIIPVKRHGLRFTLIKLFCLSEGGSFELDLKRSDRYVTQTRARVSRCIASLCMPAPDYT